MKKTRRFAAMLAAMALAATMVAPVAAYAATAAQGAGSTITVTNQDGATHTYAAYQIFAGDFSGGTLNNIIWGDGVNGDNLLAALQTASTTNGHALYGLFPSSGDNAVGSAAKVAEVLGSKTTGDAPTAVFGNDSAKAQAFAAIVAANVTNTTSGTYSNNAISQLPDGYYLVMDTAAPSSGTNNSGAKTRYIVHVTDSQDVQINAKHAAPTVDKQVQDDAGDAEAGSTNGWGETADHAINESFQFKLTATLAKDADYAAYDTYRVLFTDVLNTGVTYEDIVSVKVNGNDVTEYNSSSNKSGYLLTEPTPASGALGGGTLKISIGDIKQFLGSTAWADTNNSGVTVEVIYTAHLNENATVEKTSQNSVNTNYSNVNKVKLNYSNNPNVTGTGDSGDTPEDEHYEGDEEFGETPDDYVWVFTYEVDNIKKNENNQPMSGAGFTLYSDAEKTTAIKLINNNDGTYTVADQSASSGTVTQMTSFNDTNNTNTGKFNIKGLDAGTYYLVETSVPAGYNKCDDLTITIGATHTENTGGTAATLTLSEGSTMNNTIINKKGSELPSTGGMGTKLFIAGGGITATLAAVYLVSKKRSKED